MNKMNSIRVFYNSRNGITECFKDSSKPSPITYDKLDNLMKNSLKNKTSIIVLSDTYIEQMQQSILEIGRVPRLEHEDTDRALKLYKDYHIISEEEYDDLILHLSDY